MLGPTLCSVCLYSYDKCHSVLMLRVLILSVIMLSVIKLIVVILIVVILIVVMLCVLMSTSLKPVYNKIRTERVRQGK